jgi:SAM-dependent methyltransferase
MGGAALLALANLSAVPNQRAWRQGVPAAYFTKYANVDAAIENARSITGHDVGAVARFPGRLFSMLDFVQWGEAYGYRDCESLLVMHQDPELLLVTKRCRASATMRSFRDGYDPVRGLAMVRDALRPGGVVFTSVPALNHVHMEPVFYTMPSPWGLAMWCGLAGLQVLAIGQYGSKQNIENIAEHTTWWPRWQTYYKKERVPQMINDPDRPCDVWVLAKRPEYS